MVQIQIVASNRRRRSRDQRQRVTFGPFGPAAVRAGAGCQWIVVRSAALALALLLGVGNRAAGFTGVQTNLPVAALTGWTLCYSDTYANQSTSLSTILAACNKANLLLACRPVGSSTLSVAAHAPRADVIFDTGTTNTPHDANGVGWYFNNSWSWGFAPQGDPIFRNSCDIDASSFGSGPDPDKRLCWHTSSGNINTGWRCGATDSLNFDGSYERLIYQTDTLSCGNGVIDFGEQCDDGNTVGGDGCDAACQIEPCYTCSGSPSTCSPVPDGSACDDGLFCNGSDTCSGALCNVHSGIDPCTGGAECDNVCDEATKSCALPAGTACAEDGNPCTGDQCDGMGSCIHPPAFDFSPCDDGVFCNGADACLAGTCQFHDGDPCAGNECASTCDEAAQTCDPAAAGVPCSDDGLPCTDDQCDGEGFCAHPPLPGGAPCPDDGNVCTIDECNGIGLCIHPPAPDGTVCDDANACTQTDRCQSGHCVGTDPVICTAQACYQPGTCDPSTGTCSNCPPGYTQGHGGCEKQYAIDASLLDDLPFTCGPTRYTCNTGFGFGFHWTDTADDAVGDVTRVDLEFQPGNDCFSPSHAVALNDVPIGAYAATSAATCSCFPGDAPAVLANVDPSAYVRDGDNTVTISTVNCAGLAQDVDGRYAVVTVTYADPGLAPNLRTGCRTAAKSHFGYKNNANDALDKLLWTWGKGAATSKPDLGDPTLSTAYQLCVFRETSGRPALLFGGDVPPSATAWRAEQSGFTYDDGAGGHGGIRSMRLRDGGTGKAKLSVSAQGANLSDPALPLPLDTAGIRVQLTNESGGTCWESEFPLSRITADDKRIRATVH